ncbi:TetR family transcriptional regulator [Streptomyces sp. NPDC014734]|uniref:TetR/AcrR family transcriptional regulator n=1 Tax=Streptomyces sp. NPDC014734 TaxID=3364886 RepID=UPI0036F89119
MTSGHATAPAPAPVPEPEAGSEPELTETAAESTETELELEPDPEPESRGAGSGWEARNQLAADPSAADPSAVDAAPADAAPAGESAADPSVADPSVADQGSGRDAILRAARRAFTQRPYADVTIRGIAADAGVSPSLVVKHFGRKEELFNTVADFAPAAAELFDAPLDGLGRHLVVTLVKRRRELKSDPLLRVVFSLGNRDERSLLRDRFHQQVTEELAARLAGPEAALRAELVAGHLLGLGATLSLHPEGAGSRATPEHLADLYAPALQALITGRAAGDPGR